MTFSWKLTKSIFAFTIAAILFYCEPTEARTVKIGIYDNPPKVRMGPKGKPEGIFIDIIEYVGKHESWDIQYVYGTWEEGLTRLTEGSIDLMPDVAFSESRGQKFSFNTITVLCDWLQIYAREQASINKISDLGGKTVEVLEGSIQQKLCSDIREQLGLSFNIITMPNYKDTVQQVESGKADVLIASRFYGYNRNGTNTLIPKPVIMHPTILLYAAPKGRNQDLLDTIDKHLAVMLNIPSSVYYQSLTYWLQENPRTFIPRSVLWAIWSIIAILLFFFAWSLSLKWQVRIRTKELYENNKLLQAALQELKQTRDEALKRERLYAFGQLASGAAHDFNNLLAPIVGLTDMMLDDPEMLKNTEGTRKTLSLIRNSASYGTEIIRRMQIFSHSTEKTAINVPIDINTIIREVIELGRQHLKSRMACRKSPVEVILNLGSNCIIKGTKDLLHEMLLNLLLNASDAMPAEGGRLEISTENIKDTVRITVKDNGVGMTEEVRKKCLEPFFTTKGAAGTGMGLTMVNNIVTEHGGKFEIESAVGTGTTFTMTFPREA